MSLRANGSYIGPRLSDVSQSAAGGVWSARDVGRYTRQGVWPAAPGVASGLAVDSVGDQTIDLSWTAPSSGNVTDYLVEYTLSGGSASVQSVGSATTSYQITGLTNGTEYSVRVAASNAGLVGAYSTAVTGTPSSIIDPSTISGMIQWLDASDSSTVTSSASLYVDQLADKTSNSSAYWYSSGGSRPVVTASAQNGLQAIDFDYTTSTYLQINSSWVPVYPNATVFFVASASANASSYLISGNYGAGGQPAILSQYNITSQPSTQDFEWFSTAASYFGTWGSSGSSAVHLLTASINGSGNTVLFFDGSQVASVASSSSYTSSHGFSRIGGAPSAGYATFRLCEFIVYDSVLSTADRSAVEGYLQAKWGL